MDSLLSARKSDGEHESSRRMKTEFLVQMDGVSAGAEVRRRKQRPQLKSTTPVFQSLIVKKDTQCFQLETWFCLSLLRHYSTVEYAKPAGVPEGAKLVKARIIISHVIIHTPYTIHTTTTSE